MIMDLLKQELERLGPELKRFPWEDKKSYALFLAQVFHYVKHSSRIMSTVAAHLPQEMETMHTHLLKHTTEEMGHQFLARQDVKFLGFDLADFPELSTTKMFYEPQYYKAIYGNPIGFYGYALALEGTAVMLMRDIYEKCRAYYGEKGCNFLRVHAEEDVNHVESAVQLLEQLPAEAKAAIAANLKQSVDTMLIMLQEMKQVGGTGEFLERKAA